VVHRDRVDLFAFCHGHSFSADRQRASVRANMMTPVRRTRAPVPRSCENCGPNVSGVFDVRPPPPDQLIAGSWTACQRSDARAGGDKSDRRQADNTRRRPGAVRGSLETIVSLSKRRGFIFPSSEIYGGINAVWDYGPLGVELKNNVKRACGGQWSRSATTSSA